MDRLPHHMDRVKLVGLDFGSTTSSALVASARLGLNCATGRMEFGCPEIVYRPEPVFTPFDGQRIRLDAVAELMDGWLREAAISRDEIFGGGAIVTGLAARQDNARELAALIETTIGDAVVATADDPRLESWLSFMGSCAGLSRARPGQTILNLDIGGGTTNPALGRDGNVLATGCCFIGARHLRFEPGTYRLTGASEFGHALLDGLAIGKRVGGTLRTAEVMKAVDFYIQGLEAIVAGDASFFASDLGRLVEQVPFASESNGPPHAITFSGGVGELVYAAASGQPLPTQTFYGDLGADLAQGILASKILSRDLRSCVPEYRGRATVQGLTLHSTEVSGTTLFLPTPTLLPLRDLPVVASVTGAADRAALDAALRLAGNSGRGACLQLVWDEAMPSLEQIRRFGADLSAAMLCMPSPGMAPLVLLTTANAGKAIGNYATSWQQVHKNLIVIDEIPDRSAQFVNLGRPRHGVVPVSFYGLTSPQGDAP
ncbi:MAG: ethanolamine ammonia-lyase reactivating factor EutA [Hyphomicrobium sp.]